MTKTKAEVKRLLALSEKAQDKVAFNWNGTRVTNPRQQGAANRLYSRAHKLAQELGIDIVPIHRELLGIKSDFDHATALQEWRES